MASESVPGVIPTPEAWGRVSNAVKKIEGGQTGYTGGPSSPLLYPAVVVKVTGPASDGYYPGVILNWNSDTEAWVDGEECFIKQE